LDESERLAFIRTFDETPSDRSSVYFAVMGSHFSEGIDLKGDRLIGAMIVGVGLPVIDFENDLIKAYYDSVYGTGFEFAYQYPGINKVMQSAGRVIRDESDRGVVLLVDGRYKGRYYRQHFPEDWGRQFTTLETLTKTLKKFWEETP
jgi:Rad3-related DNA helicase